ncbi:MAG: glycosyltransferase family 2 protein [Phycisphaeraceae bacterium]|nr:glycosyltransferase family 2 protein [Phycisphaeraceae bacterium]
MKTLVAIPIFNEEKYVRRVLERVLGRARHVLVVDDGSTDRTPAMLAEYPVDVIRHAKNRGYGKSLKDAFRYAVSERYDLLITMDCDEQHEPDAIPGFIEEAATRQADIISGSRYLRQGPADDMPPADRRAINMTMTQEINARLSGSLGTHLTDAFCGFKAYKVDSLRRLRPTVSGYAFPMQFWVQAAAAGLKVRELPVSLIYNDLTRTFGGELDDARARLNHYRHILHRELRRQAHRLPVTALDGLIACGCGEDEESGDGAPRYGLA